MTSALRGGDKYIRKLGDMCVKSVNIVLCEKNIWTCTLKVSIMKELKSLNVSSVIFNGGGVI